MTAKFASWVRATVLFAALCSTATVASGKDTIHATVNSDGSLNLKGTAKVFDLDFGGADASCTDLLHLNSGGSKLMKTVTLAQHFYINGENNNEMLRPLETRQSISGVMVGALPRTVHPHSPWGDWYDRFSGHLAICWPANLPGQEQVVLAVNSDKQVHIEEEVVFIPAVSADDRFVADKTIANRFAETVKTAVANLSGNDVVLFPNGSTAKSVRFLATFVADHDLSVSVPDLRVEAIAAQDERSLRIVRLCTILEAGFLYEQADHLRTQLKERKIAHRFIPLEAQHRLMSINASHIGRPRPGGRLFGHSGPMGFGSDDADNYFLLDMRNIPGFRPIWNKLWPSGSIPPLDPTAAKNVDDFFDRCLSKSDYSSAERFAKKLVTAGSLAGREGIISRLAEPGR